MKIFLDTANRELIKKWVPTGLIDGVTTNPTLLSKEGGNIKQVLQDICALVDGPVSIEVVEKEPTAMLAQAKEISQFAKNVVVKIPFAAEYLPVIKKAVDAGIKVNATLIFTPLQSLMVAKLGVEYISPFVGRWDDIGVEGLSLLEEVVDSKDMYGFESQIIAASIRTPIQWQKAAQTGAEIVTLPPTVFEQAMKHPLTERGIEMFDNDWKKLGKKTLFE
jgi:transaldolase